MKTKPSVLIRRFSLLIAAFLCILGIANYSGFCIKEMRYLSDEEKMALAMRYFSGIEKGRYCNSFSRFEPKNRGVFCNIPYENMDEFIKQNPQCCKMLVGKEYQGGEGDGQPTFGDRVLDIYSYVVDANFLEKKTWHHDDDRDGKMKISETSEKMRQIHYFSNCGEPCEKERSNKIKMFFLLFFDTYCYID